MPSCAKKRDFVQHRLVDPFVNGRSNYPNMNQRTKTTESLIRPIIIWLLLLCVALTTAHAATITVTEVGDGIGVQTSLRQALDPRLGPLQNNSGPTFTHLPVSNSPAVDAGDPTLGMDQRGVGFARIVNGRFDTGAVEVQPTAPAHGHK